MRNILFSLCLLFSSANSFAQYNNVCDVAYTDFNNLIEAFLQLPTEQIRNAEIYNRLDELQSIINEIHASKEERYKLNSLQADISAVKEFMSPISNKYNAHLSNNNINRLQTIFGENFTKSKLIYCLLSSFIPIFFKRRSISLHQLSFCLKRYL